MVETSLLHKQARTNAPKTLNPQFILKTKKLPAVVHPYNVLKGAVMKVIFACVHNAGRSQMAAAFFNALADSAKASAVSAGTQPGERVHPEVLTVMQEIGIDLSQAKPTLLTPELAAGANMLITMGCGEACPFVPGLKRDDWGLPDPKSQPLERVREIRDEIKQRVEQLVARENLSKTAERV
jgi:arsenate reductase (thioredoxin)